MPLSGATLKAQMKTTIKAGLQREFADAVAEGEGYSAEADAQWEKLASAVADIAVDIVTAITTQAQVAPGIAVTTPAGPGVTTSPGQII